MIINLAEAKSYLKLFDRQVADITGDGTTAIMTMQNHGLKPGEQFTIIGTTSYDGTYFVEQRVDANKITFLHAASTSGETGALNEYDVVLTGFIAGVENFILNICGVKYGVNAAYTEIIDIPMDGVVRLAYANINTISALKVSIVEDFADEDKYDDVEEGEYFLYKEKGQLDLRHSDWSGYLGARKALQATYSTDEAPDGLKMAAKMLLEFWYQNYNDKSINLKSKSVQGDVRVFNNKIPEHVMACIVPFKVMRVGAGVRPPNPTGIE